MVFYLNCTISRPLGQRPTSSTVVLSSSSPATARPGGGKGERSSSSLPCSFPVVGERWRPCSNGRTGVVGRGGGGGREAPRTEGGFRRDLSRRGRKGNPHGHACHACGSPNIRHLDTHLSPTSPLLLAPGPLKRCSLLESTYGCTCPPPSSRGHQHQQQA